MLPDEIRSIIKDDIESVNLGEVFTLRDSGQDDDDLIGQHMSDVADALGGYVLPNRLMTVITNDATGEEIGVVVTVRDVGQSDQDFITQHIADLKAALEALL